MLNRMFRLTENSTDIRTEVMAGLTTFMTMAYIIFLQPAVLCGLLPGLEPTGMDFNSVMVATCLAAAVATTVMALYARYPIAQAPGMGENFFFVISVVPAAVAAGFGNGWQVALGVVFVSGVLFLIISLIGVREIIVNAISPSMKNAMAVGIGLFIAFIGLKGAGLIVGDPGTFVKLNPQFASPDLIVFFSGLLLTMVLHVRRVRGSILWGILGALCVAVVLRVCVTLCPEFKSFEAVGKSNLIVLFKFADGVVAKPPSIAPTFFKMNVTAALTLKMLPFVVIFLFMDMFDTIGTLVGVSEQAGFMKDNKLPRANRAMLSDAVGTVAGACLGTSTVTSFIESAAGVERGGRTGLTGIVVAICFLLALFFSPLIRMIGSYPSITAPALVIVGAMMMKNIRKIDLNDHSESIPAFLTIIGIPLTYSIADGLALGFISYPLVKLLSGRGREVKWLMYVLAVILVVYFVGVRAMIY